MAGLVIFGKAELRSGIPVPSLFFRRAGWLCRCSSALASPPARAACTASALPLLRKHPVPYLGRRLFFNFLEHLNSAACLRQSWLAKGQRSRGRRGGEAGGQAGESLALRTEGACGTGGGAGARQLQIPHLLHPQTRRLISLPASGAPEPLCHHSVGPASSVGEVFSWQQ